MIELKLSWAEYSEFRSRIEAFYRLNGRWPNYCDVKGVRVPMAQYEDAAIRVANFIKTVKPTRNPKSVAVYGEKIAEDDGWRYTAGYVYDKQDTDYNCAPTSMEMLLSELGIKRTEQQMASLMGTTKSGTGHSGFVAACKSLGLAVEEKTIDELTWMELERITVSPQAGAIFHFQITPELSKDVDGRLVWNSYRGGHYVYCVGVNNLKDLIKIADPTKGEVTYRFSQVRSGLEATQNKLHVKGVLVVRR